MNLLHIACFVILGFYGHADQSIATVALIAGFWIGFIAGCIVMRLAQKRR